jgi:DNA-binding CsgD family transcriptional regulator
MTGTMVGRDDELNAVVGGWRRRGRGALVSGPPGIGRTTMANAVSSALGSAGADLIVVRAARSSSPMPLGALAPLLLDNVPEGVDLRVEVDRRLTERAASGVLAVVVDDGHLLDPESAAVLSRLVDDKLAFVVVTTADDALEGPLLTHHALETVTLGQLDVDAVAALLSLHGAEVADPGPWRERSGGNPTAVLRMLADDPAGPTWASAELPDDVLDTALAATSNDVRRLLDVLAVAEPIPIAAIAALVDDPARAHELTEASIATRLVIRATTDEGDDVLRFRHQADSIAVRARLRPLRLRGVVRDAVRALRTTGRTTSADALVRIVGLSLQVGEPVETDELCTAAAIAPSLGDGALALRLARAAATRTRALADIRRWVDLAYEQGDEHGMTEALSMLHRFAAATEDPDEHEEATVAFALASAERSFWRHADGERAIRLLEHGAIGRRRDELLAVRARVLAATGNAAQAIDAATPLVGSDEPRVRAQAAVALGHAWRRRAQPTRAVRVVDDVLEQPGAADTVLLVSRQVLGSVRALALLEGARWDEAEREALDARARAERLDDDAGLAISTLVLAAVRCDQGRVTEALSGAESAHRALTRLSQPAGVRWSLAVRALASALGGDAAAALTAADRLAALPAHPATLFSGIEARARAWAHVGTRPDVARAGLLAASRSLADAGDLGAAVQCLHDLGSLGDPSTAAAELVALPDVGADPAVELRLTHLRLLDAGDHDALTALAGDYEARGGRRWAAECIAAAAASAARAGDQRTARRLSARAAELVDRCPGLATPALLAARLVELGAVPLTARERDVAVLAAQGVSSKEIAERLGLSVRTVDNHLSNCFDKLHVRRRTDLAAVLGLD